MKRDEHIRTYTCFKITHHPQHPFHDKASGSVLVKPCINMLQLYQPWPCNALAGISCCLPLQQICRLFLSVNFWKRFEVLPRKSSQPLRWTGTGEMELEKTTYSEFQSSQERVISISNNQTKSHNHKPTSILCMTNS